MDSVIEKMHNILEFTKNEKEAGRWDHKNALDLHQEMYKQHHIFNHIGRASANPSGRWFGIAVGGIGGFVAASLFVPPITKYCLRSYGTLLGGMAVGSFIGFNFMTRKFGDRKEYKLFQRKKVKTNEIMSEFEKLFE